jgi:hypothetical protein
MGSADSVVGAIRIHVCTSRLSASACEDRDEMSLGWATLAVASWTLEKTNWGSQFIDCWHCRKLFSSQREVPSTTLERTMRQSKIKFSDCSSLQFEGVAPCEGAKFKNAIGHVLCRSECEARSLEAVSLFPIIFLESFSASIALRGGVSDRSEEQL